LDENLVVQGEFSASAFTGDTRASRTSEGSTPSFFGLFTPRIGSRFDYAGSLSARYTLQDFPERMAEALDQLTVLTSYERVQPGFVSLGRPYTRSDQAIFRFQPQARFLDQRVQVGIDVTSRRNNLDESRNATLRRNQVGLTTQAQLTPALFLNTTYLWMANANEPLFEDPATTLLRQRHVSQSIMVSPVLSVPLNGLTHRFSLTAFFQNLSDKTSRVEESVRPAVNFTNVTTTLSHAVILSSGLSLNSNVSLVSSKSTSTDVSALGLNAGGSYSFFDRKLNIGLNGGVSRTTLTFENLFIDEDNLEIETENSTQLTFALNGAYRVTLRDVVRLTVRGLTTRQPLRGNFSEVQSTLRIEHRF
jgi:hypothetical protein